jgi:hypothetical protein
VQQDRVHADEGAIADLTALERRAMAHGHVGSHHGRPLRGADRGRQPRSAGGAEHDRSRPAAEDEPPPPQRAGGGERIPVPVGQEGEGVVLRTRKLGEADRIVVFLTRDRGKKRGVAKGARRAGCRDSSAVRTR